MKKKTKNNDKVTHLVIMHYPDGDDKIIGFINISDAMMFAAGAVEEGLLVSFAKKEITSIKDKDIEITCLGKAK